MVRNFTLHHKGIITTANNTIKIFTLNPDAICNICQNANFTCSKSTKPVNRSTKKKLRV